MTYTQAEWETAAKEAAKVSKHAWDLARAEPTLSGADAVLERTFEYALIRAYSEIAELREKLAAAQSQIQELLKSTVDLSLLEQERDRLRQVISDARDYLHSVRIGKSIKPEESGTLRARLLLDEELPTPEEPPEEIKIKVGDWVEFGTGAKWRVLSLITDSLGILKAGVGIRGLYATVLLSDCRNVEALAQPAEGAKE